MAKWFEELKKAYRFIRNAAKLTTLGKRGLGVVSFETPTHLRIVQCQTARLHRRDVATPAA